MVGWSLGGAVSMNFALKYPQLTYKIILMGSVHVGGFIFYTKCKKTGKLIKREIPELTKALETNLNGIFQSKNRELVK